MQARLGDSIFDTEQATRLATVFERHNGLLVPPPTIVGAFEGRRLDLYRTFRGAYVQVDRRAGLVELVDVDRAKAIFQFGRQHRDWIEAFPEDGALPLA